ncbi:hypothetical protein GCM10010112_12670 [Actinoplanes lobatus]|nr:hypothetical protein GCM10010112_12670 [Actinoplanes lobatus]
MTDVGKRLPAGPVEGAGRDRPVEVHQWFEDLAHRSDSTLQILGFHPAHSDRPGGRQSIQEDMTSVSTPWGREWPG